jgi:hypothetical protein
MWFCIYIKALQISSQRKMKDFSMLFLHRYAFILSIICLGGIDGFVTQPLAASFRSHTNQEHGSFSLWMITDQAIVEEIASARFAFGLCFFGAAGEGFYEFGLAKYP